MSAPPPTLPLLAVITNGGSTHNKLNAGWIDQHLSGEPNVLELRADGPSDIGRALADAARAGAQVVAVNGGDGTADLVFGALLNARPFAALPSVAILPAGKTNMTTAAWCGVADKTVAIRRLLELRRSGALAARTSSRPVLTLDAGDGAPPLRGAFLGAADVVDGILFCRTHIYPLGLPNALSHALTVGVLAWRSLFTRAASPAMTARWDDAGEERGQFFFLGAMTLDKLILGLSPAPTEGHGGLHYMSLKAGLDATLAAAPRFFTKHVPSGHKRHVRRARKLTLAFDGAYTLDGELYEARKERPLVITADDTLPIVDLRP